MSDNITHEQQQDEWQEWIDWTEAQDWTCLDCGDTSDVTQPGLPKQSPAAYAGKWNMVESMLMETTSRYLDLPPGDALGAEQCTTLPASGVLNLLPMEASDGLPSGHSLSSGSICNEPDNPQDQYDPDDGPTIPRSLSPTTRQAVRVAIGHCKRANNKALHCTVDGCTYAGTFPRPFELRRHIKNTHGGPKKFTCPVKGCFKGPAPWVFARDDKLTSHMRAVHHLDDEVQCPVDQCDALLPLDLLGRHLEFAHNPNEAIERQSIINAANPHYRKCPIPQCSKPLTLDVFIGHLESHNKAELESIRAVLKPQGYIFASSVTGGPIKIQIACPVNSCNTFAKGHLEFAEHLFLNHILAEGALGLRDMLSKTYMVFRMSRPGSTHTFMCSLCKRLAHKFGNDHVCKPSPTGDGSVDELQPHRQALLRLCPDFGRLNDFFDDL